MTGIYYISILLSVALFPQPGHNLFNSPHVEQFTYSVIVFAPLSVCSSSTANFLRWGAGTASIVWDVVLKHAVMILRILICNCFPNTSFAFLTAVISHMLRFLWPGLYFVFLTDRQSARCYFATVVVYHRIVIAYVLTFSLSLYLKQQILVYSAGTSHSFWVLPLFFKDTHRINCMFAYCL